MRRRATQLLLRIASRCTPLVEWIVDDTIRRHTGAFGLSLILIGVAQQSMQDWGCCSTRVFGRSLCDDGVQPGAALTWLTTLRALLVRAGIIRRRRAPQPPYQPNPGCPSSTLG